MNDEPTHRVGYRSGVADRIQIGSESRMMSSANAGVGGESESNALARRPLRVIYVSAGYPAPPGHPGEASGIGGAELQAHRVAIRLGDQFAATIITSSWGERPQPYTLDGVQVMPIPMRRAGTVGSGIDALTIAARGWRLTPPDVVQGFQLNGVTFGAASLAHLRKVPLVVKLTGRGNFESVEGRVGRLKLEVLVRAASSIVAVSQAIVDDCLRHGIPERKIELIPNGVDTDFFKAPSSSERRSARQRFEFDDEDFVFCWVGRLARAKGFKLLADAWPDIVARHVRARLLIAGGGGSEDNVAQDLAHRHGNSVRWLGSLRDVRPVYASSDAHVLTSPAEGLSGVTLEASASGLVSIVPDNPENVEIGEGSDFLVPYRREAGHLAGAMIAVIQRRKELSGVGQRARGRVVESYSLPSVVDRWQRLYLSQAGYESQYASKPAPVPVTD